MKGLLVKDINIMLGNVRAILPTMGIGVIYVFLTDTTISFGMSFMIMLFGMLALSTLAYDEENDGMAYLMTLPVSRYQYVLSKYLFLVFFLAVGAAVSLATFFLSAMIKGIMSHTGSLDILQRVGFGQREEYMSGLIALMVMFLLSMVLLPLRYKFGAAMQQVMALVVVVSVILLAMALGKLTKTYGIDPDQWLVGLNGWGVTALALLAVGLCVAGFLVSLGVSTHVIARKEF